MNVQFLVELDEFYILNIHYVKRIYYRMTRFINYIQCSCKLLLNGSPLSWAGSIPIKLSWLYTLGNTLTKRPCPPGWCPVKAGFPTCQPAALFPAWPKMAVVRCIRVFTGLAKPRSKLSCLWTQGSELTSNLLETTEFSFSSIVRWCGKYILLCKLGVTMD